MTLITIIYFGVDCGHVFVSSWFQGISHLSMWN